MHSCVQNTLNVGLPVASRSRIDSIEIDHREFEDEGKLVYELQNYLLVSHGNASISCVL